MARMDVDLNEYGYDAWGFHARTFRRVMVLARLFYRHWFRVQATGVEYVPAGRVMLVGNHSGQLPFDAAMVSTALFLEAEPPRAVKAMVERLAARTPFISELFVRLGQVTGNPENCHRMLREGHAVLVFPEGARGTGKLWKDRYTLEHFGTGFLRMCLETRAPIVPFACVGFEESIVSFSRLGPLARLFRLPYIPLTPTLLPLPLPTKCHIVFGRPLRFRGSADEEEPALQRKVSRVRRAILRLIDEGLRRREGVF
ncbi:MAG: acyltransferase family protein [Planctomycetes bacterium]|nr:acyltransferase family protein [Planctomycetota bacterium]